MNRILDVGCGRDKYRGAVGMDRIASPGVDILHDMESTPWPIKDSVFDVVRMSHSLEHVPRTNILRVLEDAHRVLRLGGILAIRTPIGIDFWNDPTHHSYIPIGFWKSFHPNYPFNYYTRPRFKLRSARMESVIGVPSMVGLLAPIYRRHPSPIERILWGLGLGACVEYRLERL